MKAKSFPEEFNMNITYLKSRCVFLSRYRRIGPRHWIRIDQPAIDISDDPWPVVYQNPQIQLIGETRLEIRVKDDDAVDLENDSLLGDYFTAANRCDEFLESFPGNVILDNLSQW
jgi:hypothetical protein